VDDRIAEPVRAALLPGFLEAKHAALAAGALGCSISGAGSSLFAFADSDELAAAVCAAVVRAYAGVGVAATGRVARVDTVGARLVHGA
jgi:homoserine kinase